MRRNGTLKGELRKLSVELGRDCIWEGPWGGRRCKMGGTLRWPIELAFCHWLATGRKRKDQDKALWEIGSQRKSSVWDTQY